jgi:hypothetical protein
LGWHLVKGEGQRFPDHQPTDDPRRVRQADVTGRNVYLQCLVQLPAWFAAGLPSLTRFRSSVLIQRAFHKFRRLSQGVGHRQWTNCFRPGDFPGWPRSLEQRTSGRAACRIDGHVWLRRWTGSSMPMSTWSLDPGGARRSGVETPSVQVSIETPIRDRCSRCSPMCRSEVQGPSVCRSMDSFVGPQVIIDAHHRVRVSECVFVGWWAV